MNVIEFIQNNVGYSVAVIVFIVVVLVRILFYQRIICNQRSRFRSLPTQKDGKDEKDQLEVPISS